MKRYYLTSWLVVALFLSLAVETMAQGVVVYRKNGSPIKVPYSELDSIATYNYDDGSGIPVKESFLDCPDSNHPHMIDLDLPSGTRWACCNVGAETPEDYGDFYAWGETEVKPSYSFTEYSYYDELGDRIYDIGSDISGTRYDVAHVKWGGYWVLPSLDQLDELVKNCTYEFTTQNGVGGGKFTGKNGGVIFLPAAGTRWDENHYYTEGIGSYWASETDEGKEYCAFNLHFYSGGVRWASNLRYLGYSVRPVSW